MCAQVQAVKDSFNALADTNVAAEGTNVLKSRFETFTADLESLKAAASSQFESQFDAVQASVDQLQTVIDDAEAAGVATTAAQFIAGLEGLTTTLQEVFTAVDRACA
jgi:hypothetical protein